MSAAVATPATSSATTQSTPATTSSSSSSAAPTTSKRCPVCQKEGTKVCGGCGTVAYCSKEHQREDWKSHKTACAQKHKSTAVASSSSSNSNQVSVTWADQQSINLFSRLTLKLSNIQDELATKQQVFENTKDAKSDIELLLDDDACKIQVGEVFIQVTNEQAEEFAHKRQQELQTEVDTLRSQIEDIQQQMKELKVKLYAKFGDQINLEYETKEK